MRLVHLTSSTFFGGPERQMLGLAEALRGRADVQILSFAECGKCDAFLTEAERRGFQGEKLPFDTPHLWSARGELVQRLRSSRPDVLLCHGYKANIIGRRAALSANVPSIAVSRGWTGESWRVRVYEALDRWELPNFEHIVAVSAAQASKVVDAGVPSDRVTVIRNSARVGAFSPPSSQGRSKLESLAASPGDFLIIAMARLSPEKGIHLLIDAAERIIARHPGARFLVFGNGPERERLEALIAEAELSDAFSLPGFRSDLDELIANADLAVLPSFNEGLPNAVLEASAAGIPIVATRVGGTPEAIIDGETGWLVPPGDAAALADAVSALLESPYKRQRLGNAGRDFVRTEFSFAVQAQAYLDLLTQMGIGRPSQGRRAA